jgi:hypothetical protein
MIAVDDVMKKWANLKDTFHAHRKAFEKKCVSGSGAVVPPTWKWWLLFEFMLDSHYRQR